MGFLDKLLGRTKEVASDVATKTGDVAEQAVDVAGDAVDKGADVAGDVYEKGKDLIDGDKPKDPGASTPPSGGSTPA